MRRKRRNAFMSELRGNTLFLAFHLRPTDFFGGKPSMIAIYDSELDSIVLFPKALKRYALKGTLETEIIFTIAHENLHKTIFHTLSPREYFNPRFRECEEHIVLLLENFLRRDDIDSFWEEVR